jgi:hypothetical protein
MYCTIICTIDIVCMYGTDTVCMFLDVTYIIYLFRYSFSNIPEVDD